MFYKRLIWPALQRWDAELTHERTLDALSLAQAHWPGRLLLRLMAGRCPAQPIQLWGLTFPNVLGIAAGFDKDVRVAAGLANLGFGHIEVGTLTPRPQEGNERPRIFRLPQAGALVNRMGFPNGGVAAALPLLRALKRPSRRFVLGVSVGKQKETPLAEAAADYETVMQAVYPYADYIAINISSPNTPGLRDLQSGRYLAALLGRVKAAGERMAEQNDVAERPLLVKIAPDLEIAELTEIVAEAEAAGVGGIIATNTTVDRSRLGAQLDVPSGGLSGRPLNEPSTAVIRQLAAQTHLPIIGVGGVRSAVDVRAKLDAGARLVQTYTGLIYEGPRLAGHILRQLRRQEKYES